MKRPSISVRLCAFLLPVTLLSCTTTVVKESLPAPASGKYDTAFPHRNSSAQLSEISDCVKLLGSIAYYKTYFFPLDQRVRAPFLNSRIESGPVGKPVYSNRTTSGTATIISYDQKRIVLLTCAHVVAFPDTVLKFYSDEEGHRTHFVKTCAIKERQTNYVGVLPEGGELEIIAMDPARDIALLGHRFIGEAPVQFPVFHYPLGKAGDLDWGSFVYIFGFPSGYRMITTGIVSNPNRDRNKTFFVDAVLSRGYSGGIAIAMRNGAPNFELVGMVKLVSGETQRSLVPPPTVDEEDYDPTVPYRGDIYVERETNIQYGVGQAVSVDAIRDFLKERLSKIQDKGYQIPQEWLGD